MKSTTNCMDTADIPFPLQLAGFAVGDYIFEKLKEGELSHDDDVVISWIPCILGEGNLEFLSALADSMYKDARAEIINEFLQTVQEKRTKGEEIIKGD